MIRTGPCAVWPLVLLVWLGFQAGAPGQETPDAEIEALEARVSRFLEGVSLGETRKAYEELLAGSQLLKQTEAVDGLVEKTGTIKDRFGEYWAFERIDRKRIGADLVLMKYLYKCRDFPVVWYFTFYRTPQEGLASEGGIWRVITVRFDTQLEPPGW